MQPITKNDLIRPVSLILIFCAFLSTMLCIGQELTLSGFVDDVQDQPIKYATILVMKAQDSTIINGASSNDEGFFLVKDLAEDSYLVKVSFLGFTDFYTSIALTESVDLGTIMLEESSEMLNEINIIAKKPILTKEADRLVFNIENTALVEGNMFQVLKSTPGVLVLDNAILVKNSPPTVYINNKKVHLSNEELVQLLESSSANSIKSVEVITNPSAKYDAESGAVINIVMGKNMVTGYRGNVFSNYTQGVFPRYEVGSSHFFKNEKINFFANYTYSQDKINSDITDITDYFDNANIDQTFISHVNRNTRSKTHNFNFNFDYSIDESNTLSLSSSMLLLPYFNYLIKNNTDVVDRNEALQYNIMTNNTSDDDKYNLGFDLDFAHQFNKSGEKLSANAHFTTYDYSRNQNVTSNYFDANDAFIQTTAYRTDNNQDTKIYTTQADYVLPIGEDSTFETGLKTSTIENNSDIAQFDIENGEETVDVNNTNDFDYKENINAAYANYSKDWEKLSLIAGIRAEYTDSKGVSAIIDNQNKQSYLDWFPTASLSYKFTDNFSLYTNYKRIIERPAYQDLNPFKFYLNDFTIVSGNPNLKPILTDKFVIGSTLFKIFTVETYYKVQHDNIFQLPLQDNENNTITYASLNFDQTTEYGFDFETYFDVVSNWSVYVLISFFNQKNEGVFENNSINKELWVNFTQLSNDFSFLKDKSLNANFKIVYYGKNLNGFEEVSAALSSDMSISKSVFKKKGTISLSATDLFNQQDFDVRTRYLNQSNFSSFDFDSRYVKLGFRYKFGNTNLETNQHTKEQEETDRLEKKGN
ncbi:MAG: outer membrane beta-barrel family protein [Aquaticitalea sp.]